MNNNKQQTAVEFIEYQVLHKRITDYFLLREMIKQAKEMEKEQMGYTKEDVLKAGEMGEINHHDTKHIVSYLDEAKQYNETFNK